MSTSMILLLLATAVILVLAGYAGWLCWQLYQRRKLGEQRLAELASLVGEERQKRISSIRILAQGLLDDQLSATEAAIRITALLDKLGQGASARELHGSLYKLADETLHIPRLEAWQALSGKERRRYDRERLQSEAKYRDFIQASARILVAYEIPSAPD